MNGSRSSIDQMREAMDDRHVGQSALALAGVRIGERIGVWCRPAADCIYVFGFGHYAGDQNINGEMFPVVTFDDKREMVLRYPGIECGRQAWVKNAVEEFDGDVHSIDLERYLDPHFEHPTREDGRVTNAAGGVDLEAEPQARRVGPETVFDKLNRLSLEATECHAKIKMANGAIAKQEERLTSIHEEMAPLRAQALAEVDKLSGLAPAPQEEEE